MLAARGGGKYVAGELSTYCWDDCACATDLFRAGETPELRTWGMLLVGLSPHGVRLIFQLSVSDDATREPDPVLPSIRSDGAPMYVLFSRGRELSLAFEAKPVPRVLLFQMLPILLPQGAAFPNPAV